MATAALCSACGAARPQKGRAEDGQAGGGWSTWTGVSSVKSGFVAASEVVMGVVSAGLMLSGATGGGQPRGGIGDSDRETRPSVALNLAAGARR